MFANNANLLICKYILIRKGFLAQLMFIPVHS